MSTYSSIGPDAAAATGRRSALSGVLSNAGSPSTQCPTPAVARGHHTDGTSTDLRTHHSTLDASPASAERRCPHDPYRVWEADAAVQGVPNLASGWLEQQGYRKCQPLAVRVESPPPEDDFAAKPSNSRCDDGPQDDVLHPAPQPHAEAAAATSHSNVVASPREKNTAHEPKETHQVPAEAVALVHCGRRTGYFCVGADLARVCRHAVGSLVVVDGDRGEDAGMLAMVLPVPTGGRPELWVRRMATRADNEQRLAMYDQARRAFEFVRRLQKRLMTDDFRFAELLACEFQHDGGKLFVYFSHHRRIEFGRLTGAIFSKFRCRVWFHQTGHHYQPSAPTAD